MEKEDFTLKKLKKITAFTISLAIVFSLFTGIPVSAAEEDGFEYRSSGGSIIITGFTDELEGDIIIPSRINSKTVTAIDDDAFSGCTAITSVKAPSGLREIGDSAFSGCTNLESITLPDSVREIGENAFENCTSLISFTFPESVKVVSPYTFYGCTSLGSGTGRVRMGENITTIGESAFSDCTGMKRLYLPDRLTTIGKEAFYGCSSLTSIDIPSGVKTISQRAFAACESLTDVEFSNGLTTISDEAFSGCSSLESVDLPTSVTKIGREAFMECYSMTRLDLANSLNSLGSYAFAGCESLEDVIIPATLKEVPSAAFFECSSLYKVTLKRGVQTVESEAFAYCDNLEQFYVPETVNYIARSALYGSYPTIYGYTNTTARTFAKDNDYDFSSLGTAPNTNTVPDSGSSGSTGGGSTTVDPNDPLVYNGVKYKGAIMFDTLNYTMAPGDIYDIGVRMLGNASTKTLKVYASRDGVATVAKLANGNYRITGRKADSTPCYIMLEVWDNGVQLNHYSVRVDVKNGVLKGGQAARNWSYFN